MKSSLINSSLDEYYQLLANVGMDIYDSCIKDFYSQYFPYVYKRHGNLSGFNLYNANEIFYDGDTVITFTNGTKIVVTAQQNHQHNRSQREQ